jgi:hypothetical protein
MFDKAGLRVATVGPGNKVMPKTVTIMRDLGKIIELDSGLSPDDPSLKVHRMVLLMAIACASLIRPKAGRNRGYVR